MEFIGKYRILQEIGRGNMGVVYRGFDPDLKRDVAIKVIRGFGFATPEAQAMSERRFRQEAQAAANLNHPGIVDVYDFGSTKDGHYLVMELVPGTSLDHKLEQTPLLELNFALDLLTQLAAALDYAHGKRVVHRDVKPGNVMVTPTGFVKLTDFGLARTAEDTVTLTHSQRGTPAYMSPEQVKNEPTSGRSDQFSFGIVAFELLTGRRPFVAATPYALMFQIGSQPPPLANEINPALAPDMSDVLRRAMAMSPADRFSSCTEFVSNLRSNLGSTVKPAAEAGLGSEQTVVAPRPGPAILPGRTPNPGDTRPGPDGLTYVWIPPGKFLMGCSMDPECPDNEKPQHEVQITKGFWLGRTPVIQYAYEHVVGENPSHFKGPNLPVENVSWADADEYCGKVGARLPTEAEWEYAARAGESSRYWTGLRAWFEENADGRTHNVGEKAPNAWGLYDMLGNVWEWVSDWYEPDYYRVSPPKDPTGPGVGFSKVLRGGSWSDGLAQIRLSARDGDQLFVRNSSIGFRCVRGVLP